MTALGIELLPRAELPHIELPHIESVPSFRATLTVAESAESQPLPGTKLTRRGRVVIFLVALTAVALLAVAFGPSTVATSDAGQLPPVRTLTVQPGDTLWDIARQANPGGSVHATIDDILKLNSKSSVADVRLGDKIAVPVYSK